MQDNFDIHQRHASQEEQLRTLRTRFENREEQLRGLADTVEGSDWDVKLSQIRQAESLRGFLVGFMAFR